MIRLNRIALIHPLIMLALAGCGHNSPNGSSPSSPAPGTISVSPSSITVNPGSTTTFTAEFTPSLPLGGSLTWSVNPANGGTITSAGFFTAAGTAGNYAVVATWTPSIGAAGTIISGSATVKVLPAPQSDAELNLNFVLASGTNQSYGKIQNIAIVGQLVPFAVPLDPHSSVQIRTGFTIPVTCSGLDPSCH